MPKATTPTRSAGGHLLAEKRLAAVVERIRSWGCREVRSKKSTIRRRSRTCWRNFFGRGDAADGDGYGRGIGGFGLFDFLHVVVVEGGDFLFLTVLGDGELILAQSLDGLAVAAGDLDVDLDQLDGGADGAFVVRRRLAEAGRRRAGWRGILRDARRDAGARAPESASASASDEVRARFVWDECCSAHQKFILVMMSMVRMAAAPMTRPKVDEPTRSRAR